MRGNSEFKEVFRNAALAVGGPTRFNTQWPLGEGWIKMFLRVDHVVTIGTGAGPITDAGLRLIRSVMLRTDKGDYPVNNAPGRWLNYAASMKTGSRPKNDAFLAANGTYTTILPIWFYDPKALRSEDTIFNSGRYQTIELVVTYGPLTDAYTAPGTATVAPVLSAYIDRQKGPVPSEIMPKFTVEYGVRGPFDPSSAGAVVDMERSANLSYKKWGVYTGVGNLVTGQPFTGDPSNTVLTDLTVDHDQGRPYETTPWTTLQEQNKDDFSFESVISGLAVQDFAKDGSLQSALFAGDKARLREMWTYSAGVASLSVGYEALRPLVP